MIRIWSSREILFLRHNYLNNGAQYCAKKLKRTLGAIRKKAGLLRIVRPANRVIYLKQNFKKVVEKSESLTEVIRNLKLRAAGGNYKIIKKYINLYKLDTSHFLSQSEIMKRVVDRHVRKPLSEILVENNQIANSTNIKERLYKEGLKQRNCELCGQNELWMNKKMSLILDHKNGIHSDYRLENLQIVCPNCNATLDTHCGKNNKKNKCTKCHIEILHKGKFCRNCYGEELKGKPKFYLRKVKNRPSEKDLRKDVLRLGYCGTGRKYGVSDNAIRKWLKNMK